ncbi:sensor histidine kinase [Streptoalloteichus hindustanus]|uniref:Histidine kinase-like ATPase domain-containing protein n=1 Tax=Streptoalloteichus hindustanus TaxID=2017 RepID=A0A1M5CFR9_STRHI|nr:ATP-binding protein [Streptoalloteichus hindustanus]SHF53578.1 Histidine kinase-like ATPase domain-containing protein [Streptoalloteichus hindustanus]
MAGVGAVGREISRLGRRFAVGLRVVVVGLCTLLWLGFASTRQPALAALTTVGFTAWSAFHGFWLLRGRSLLVADVVVVCAVCLAQPWTDAVGAQQDSTSWTLAVVSIVVVAYQWHLRVVPGGVATVLITFAYLAGVVLSRPESWLVGVPLGVWTAVEAVLARALFTLLTKGAKAADDATERAGRARRAAVVARVRREDEREHLAAIHDTASATLLMVGLGVVRRREAWLSARAAKDREVILGRADACDTELDLVGELRENVDAGPLRVRWEAARPTFVPASVAAAFSCAVREAFINVVRHAGVDEVVVQVRREGGTVRVEVSDAGRGFEPQGVPNGRYGLTRSIVGRMRGAGGSAEITSIPGYGTRVRLEWPNALA